MDSNYGKGLLLAFMTAIISGISVFINGEAVKLADPFAYTTVKNIGALLFLGAITLLFTQLHHFRGISRKNWIMLAGIGVVGGSLPFLMFFYGLKLGGAAVSSFIFRSLFIFAGVFGYLILKERPEAKDLAAGLLLLGGNALLVSGELMFSLPQLLVLGATALWALEYTLSRKLLSDVHPRVVMTSRLFFGAILLLGFLGATGSIAAFESISMEMLLWLFLTAAMLTGFLLAWYNTLKYLPVLKATAVLALGGIITASLKTLFGAQVTLVEGFGFLLILVGAGIMVGLAGFHEAARAIRGIPGMVR